jgi:hypothetical protein
MAAIGYLIRVELKKHPGTAPEQTKSYFVLPPSDPGKDDWTGTEKAFDVLADAIHTTSTNLRFPVIEEVSQRRMVVEDLRSLRNTLLFEKNGWRCFSVPY